MHTGHLISRKAVQLKPKLETTKQKGGRWGGRKLFKSFPIRHSNSHITSEHHIDNFSGFLVLEVCLLGIKKNFSGAHYFLQNEY